MSQAVSLARALRRYFVNFGGWRAVLSSPLLWLSVLFAALRHDLWVGDKWIGTAESLIPGLLGFSLGTYSILFSLMTPRLKLAMRAQTNDHGIPFLDEVNATFFHFIAVQIICLVWAFLGESTFLSDLLYDCGRARPILLIGFKVSGFFGTVLFFYSILLMLGAALAVHRLASIVDRGADS